MAVAVFVQTLDKLQHSTLCMSESQSLRLLMYFIADKN
jgi:hypothetical protein